MTKKAVWFGLTQGLIYCMWDWGDCIKTMTSLCRPKLGDKVNHPRGESWKPVRGDYEWESEVGMNMRVA